MFFYAFVSYKTSIYLILISCFVKDKLTSVYTTKNIVFYFAFAYFFLVFQHLISNLWTDSVFEDGKIYESM